MDYTVAQGDTTASLAIENGHFWKTIWQHGNNSQLRSLRKHPNILNPGDKLFIPALRPQEFSRPTDAVHKFVRKGLPEKFNVQFRDYDDQPYANAPYLLRIDDLVTHGNLDGEGWLRIFVRPNVKSGFIEIGQGANLLACNLNFGHLDPPSELSGLQARLRNLGYYDGPIDGTDSETLQNAVSSFRQAHEIPESADIAARLEALHRS